MNTHQLNLSKKSIHIYSVVWLESISYWIHNLFQWFSFRSWYCNQIWHDLNVSIVHKWYFVICRTTFVSIHLIFCYENSFDLICHSRCIWILFFYWNCIFKKSCFCSKKFENSIHSKIEYFQNMLHLLLLNELWKNHFRMIFSKLIIVLKLTLNLKLIVISKQTIFSKLIYDDKIYCDIC